MFASYAIIAKNEHVKQQLRMRDFDMNQTKVEKDRIDKIFRFLSDDEITKQISLEEDELAFVQAFRLRHKEETLRLL